MKLARWCLIVLAGAAPAALAQPARAAPAPLSAAPPKPLELVEAREVRLERPVTFWREGRQESTGTAVLLRVKVGGLSAFAPRGITAPLFVYGSTVCQELRSPLSGEAVLLAPRVSAGEPPVLWLTPPMVLEPKDVDKEVVRQHRPKGAELERGRGLLAEPTAALSERVYKDVDELKEELKKEILRSRER